MDPLTPERRSEVMRRVKGRDTGPELALRKALHGLGYRYRLHVPDLPGKPDLVFPRLGKAIFVHGCFWHGHSCRAGRNRPSSNQDYWTAKLERNCRRDVANRRALRQLGWSVLTVWECELRSMDKVLRRAQRFLAS